MTTVEEPPERNGDDPRPLRVLFVLRKFPMSSGSFLRDQIGGLLDRGHEVDVLAQPPDNPDVGAATIERADVRERVRYAERPPHLPWRRVRRAWRVWRTATAEVRPYLRRSLAFWRYGAPAARLRLFFDAAAVGAPRRYDAVHAHFGLTCVRAMRLIQLGSVRGPLVASFHGHDATYARSPRRDRYYPALFAHAACVTTPSRFVADLLEAKGCPREKLIVFPVGVNVRAFPFRVRTPAPGTPVRVLSVGRLVEQKGHLDAIRAVARLLPRFPSLRYDIVGEGRWRSRLEAEIERLGLHDAVRLLGERPHAEIPELHARAHVFLQPSVHGTRGNREALAVSALEAQASGLPVIATNVGGIPEVVEDGVSGLLVPPGDAEALATRLAWLLENPAWWAKLGTAGRENVRTRFDQRGLLDRQVRLYRSLGTARV